MTARPRERSAGDQTERARRQLALSRIAEPSSDLFPMLAYRAWEYAGG